MSSEKTLFIFEGARTEGKLVRSLENNFLGKTDSIKCVFDAEIYQLYRAIKKEAGDFGTDFIDVVAILKERKINSEALKGYNRDSFAYIYLFFDYDGGSSTKMGERPDEMISEMLSLFNEETGNGKLFISYPMVEALWHFKNLEDFKGLTAKCKSRKCPGAGTCDSRADCEKEPHYKTIVSKECSPRLTNLNSYKADVWRELIYAHILKANHLVNDDFSFPVNLISQEDIFAKQLLKHINQDCPSVAVLSSLPLYVLDYFGCEKLKARLRDKE